MRRLAAVWLCLLCLLSLCAAGSSPAAPRTLGLLLDTPEGVNRLAWARSVDLLLDSLALSRRWETTILSPESPLLRAAGLPWPQPPEQDWLALAAALQKLVDALELDDLLILRPVTPRLNELEALWLRAGQPELRQLRLVDSASGDKAFRALGRQLLAALDRGPEQAPLATKSAPVPPAAASAPIMPAHKDDSKPQEETAQPPLAPATPSSPSGPRPPGAETPRPFPQPPAKSPSGALQPPAPSPTKPSTETSKPESPAPAPLQPPPEAESPSSTAATPFLSAARKYLQEGDFNRAEEMLIKAQQAGEPRAALFLAWADLERARQNPQAERKWLQQALAEDDSLVSAHLRLGELLRQAGLWRKALAEYQAVLQREPENVAAYLGLAAIYARQNQPRRAAEMIAEALKHTPDDPTLYLRLGDLYAQGREWAEAENAYYRALRLLQGPARAEPLDRLGNLYLLAERKREAFICFAEASKLRGGGASSVAEKRYQQITQAADQALREAAARAQTALHAYLAGQGVYREEAWLAAQDFQAQARELLAFLDSVVPPATLKKAHLQRRLAYSLATEAALAALDYIDCGDNKQQRLQDFQRLLTEALETLPAL